MGITDVDGGLDVAPSAVSTAARCSRTVLVGLMLAAVAG